MRLFLIFLTVLFIGCRQRSQSNIAVAQTVDTLVAGTETNLPVPLHYDTTNWTELTPEHGYSLDIKYATTDNFVHEAVYPCGRCFLKPAAAKALANARDQLEKQGYKLKLFDCYRPRPVQKKLWKKVPDPSYVAPPTEGSMHNRGVAVDLTLTDLNGQEIDMGTAYDFFGPEAHHTYSKHDPAILKHREILKSVMESHGFASIRTEWWHYSYTKGSYPLEDWEWPCLEVEGSK